MNTFQEKFKIYFKNHPITTIILLLNLFMVIVLLVMGGFTIENLVKLGGLVPAKISEDGDYHRLVLSMFLHGSLLHFLFNSYFLYHLGGFVEKLLGRSKFIIIYFISGIGSSLLVWWLGDPYKVTIGASGALFGIMGALLVLTYIKTSWFNIYTIKNIRTLVVINLIFTFLARNISVLGHLGGFITGIGLIYLLTPKNPLEKNAFTFKKQKTTDVDIIDHDDIDDDDIYIS
ncbi:rhomboid family intramembrane serine protease [Mycoplasmatota bacterium]|nr:rhomboid family intramembrane serine protease [Mycoplasmatota bacterium]